ncbi:hypothetical protein [Pseudomonas silesiensis]|uniref:hypothetical protein n=1 Tax=Pseudomonas silesiensis TaxID=1853130 RepID=UPI0034D68942
MDQAKIRQVGQIEHGMTWLRPPPLSPAAFKALIAERGWRMADVACRWAIRPEHLSRIAADAARETKWDDGVRALPTLSRREQTAVTAARRQLVPNPPRSRQVKTGDLSADALAPENAAAGVPGRPFSWGAEDDEEDEAMAAEGDGFRYRGYLSRGDELVAVKAIEGFAREHALLVVIATRLGVDSAGGAQEQYHCESGTGEQRWFAPEQIDDGLVSNGKTRELR